MSQLSRLLVSVVTPSYNSEQTIEATIQSVLGQTYTPIEYLVVDGASKDNTVGLAQRYAPRLKLISEPDRGQSDAINKGWCLLHGDILAWLNADDQYFSDTVQQAAAYFEAHPDAAWLYGALHSVDPQGRAFPSRAFESAWDYAALLGVGCYVAQPTVFVRRQVIEAFGYLDETLHYAMDYEYWLRIGQRYPGHFVPSVRAQMIRSAKTKTESGGVPRIREIEAVIRRYGGTDLPRGIHHGWTMAFIEQALKQTRAGHLRQAAQSFRQAGRYPRALPRGVAKVLIRLFVPQALETQLRQRFIRRTPNTQ